MERTWYIIVDQKGNETLSDREQKQRLLERADRFTIKRMLETARELRILTAPMGCWNKK